jgi:hypothetical protein
LDKYEILDTFISKDGRLKAEIVNYNSSEREWGFDAVFFYEDGVFITSESIEGKSYRYYEEIAENYVNGIKKV